MSTWCGDKEAEGEGGKEQPVPNHLTVELPTDGSLCLPDSHYCYSLNLQGKCAALRSVFHRPPYSGERSTSGRPAAICLLNKQPGHHNL